MSGTSMPPLAGGASPESDEDRARRLRWQCRRGLKELDVILEPFMEAHYSSLSAPDQGLFSALVAEEDVDLLAWFMGYQVPERTDYQRLIHDILQRVAT